MGVLDSRGLMDVVLEKLDVDGVGGARLESIAIKAAGWRELALQESPWRLQIEYKFCGGTQCLIAWKAQQS